MTISEKNMYLKNKYIHLATVTAGLALGNLSDVSANTGYVSPTATFLSAETCAIPVDCETINAIAGPSGANGRA